MTSEASSVVELHPAGEAEEAFRFACAGGTPRGGGDARPAHALRPRGRVEPVIGETRRRRRLGAALSADADQPECDAGGRRAAGLHVQLPDGWTPLRARAARAG